MYWEEWAEEDEGAVGEIVTLEVAFPSNHHVPPTYPHFPPLLSSTFSFAVFPHSLFCSAGYKHSLYIVLRCPWSWFCSSAVCSHIFYFVLHFTSFLILCCSLFSSFFFSLCILSILPFLFCSLSSFLISFFCSLPSFHILVCAVHTPYFVIKAPPWFHLGLG